MSFFGHLCSLAWPCHHSCADQICVAGKAELRAGPRRPRRRRRRASGREDAADADALANFAALTGGTNVVVRYGTGQYVEGDHQWAQNNVVKL